MLAILSLTELFFGLFTVVSWVVHVHRVDLIRHGGIKIYARSRSFPCLRKYMLYFKGKRYSITCLKFYLGALSLCDRSPYIRSVEVGRYISC